jgi:hypothetical protein
MLLIVEYDVDSGNLWVPRIHYPSKHSMRLSPRAGFHEPRLLATAPSRFLKAFYFGI